MNDRDIDDILHRASGAPHHVDTAIIDRISSSIDPSLRPVRPLPPAWALATGLFLAFAAVAFAGAAFLGFYGIRKLTAAQIMLVFTVLSSLAWLAALSSVAEMTPGSARPVPAMWLPVVVVLTLIATFTVLPSDNRVDRFVPQGLACLTVGLLHAVAAGMASWLLLRQGFAVSPLAAGLVTGTLASLAGVVMLEIHCANFQKLHVLVWHTAVVPLGALAGALLAGAVMLTTHSPRRG